MSPHSVSARTPPIAVLGHAWQAWVVIGHGGHSASVCSGCGRQVWCNIDALVGRAPARPLAGTPHPGGPHAPGGLVPLVHSEVRCVSSLRPPHLYECHEACKVCVGRQTWGARGRAGGRARGERARDCAIQRCGGSSMARPLQHGAAWRAETLELTDQISSQRQRRLEAVRQPQGGAVVGWSADQSVNVSPRRAAPSWWRDGPGKRGCSGGASRQGWGSGGGQ